MNFKKFVRWCSDRAADGCWSFDTACFFTSIIARTQSLPFWKRNKEFKRICETVDILGIVNYCDRKRKELYNR